MSVAATNQNDNLASFSNFGASSVDLAAPGDNIVSTWPGGFAFSSGTSMAAGIVSGTAALIKARSPGLSATRIISILMSSVDALPSLAGRVASGGRINAQRAVGGAEIASNGGGDDSTCFIGTVLDGKGSRSPWGYLIAFTGLAMLILISSVAVKFRRRQGRPGTP